MATVASIQSGFDGVTGSPARPIRGVVALRISATKALIVAQTSGADGFDQLLTAANELVFAVPALKDTDDVLGAQLVAADANLSIAYCKRNASGASPTVNMGIFNAGANNAQPANDPVLIDITVARR